MSRDWRLHVRDIREACHRIARYVEGLDFEHFEQDQKTVDAVLRNLEVIGEAAKHVPNEIREQHAGLPWRKIAALRDVVIHEYFGVDLDVIWDVVQSRMPTLLREADAILARHGG